MTGLPGTAQDVIKFAEFVATGDFSAAEALLGEGLEDLADTVPGKILVGGKKIADRGFNEIKRGLNSVSRRTTAWANTHLKNKVTVEAVKGLNEMVDFTNDVTDKLASFVKDDVLPSVSKGLEKSIVKVGDEFVGWLKGDVGGFFKDDVGRFFEDIGVEIGDGFVDFFTGKLFR